jgi:putative ABC transport system permease protein
MLRLASLTVRGRWPSLLGAFVALAAGVAVVAGALATSMAVTDATRSDPVRYGAAPVVVAGDPVIRDQADPSITELHESHLALPVELVTDLRHLNGVEAVAADRKVSLRLVEGGNAEELIGRPWPVHAAAPYELVEGRAPAGRNEIVVATGAAGLSGTGPGAVVELGTPVGVSS